MVTGPMRKVLWFLGALGVLWLLLGLFLLPSMSRMMEGGGMMGGGMMGGGMMGMGGMMSMMALMLIQLVAMLGLVGVFVYLVVDSRRSRPTPRVL